MTLREIEDFLDARENRREPMPRLVLARRDGEAIVIGDDIRITVDGTRAGAARLVIEAPREVRMMREELLARVTLPDVPEPAELVEVCDPWSHWQDESLGEAG